MKNAFPSLSIYYLAGILSLIIALSCNEKKNSQYDEEIRSYREDYLKSFLTEERSPLNREDLKFLSFFQADSTFRVMADYVKLDNETPFDIPTSSGKTKPYRKYATLNFSLKDTIYSLYVYESMKLLESEEYRDYLFLPFTDLTNGTETYGGGRYLDLNKKDFESPYVLIDFNKAYNPWCAYSDGYNCPIPPQDNDLSVAILAGEMKYTGAYKHQPNEH
jgi:uncharacterized protein (DUF1684 family)